MIHSKCVTLDVLVQQNAWAGGWRGMQRLHAPTHNTPAAWPLLFTLIMLRICLPHPECNACAQPARTCPGRRAAPAVPLPSRL